MKAVLLASVAPAIAAAFMSDVCDVVMAKPKGGGDPVRVNKADFDADQERDTEDREWSPAPKSAEPAEPSIPASTIADGPPLANPSAPDFNGPSDDGAAALPIDPLKNAAAPISPGPNARAVMKKGKKYHAVDANTGETLKLDGIEPDGYNTEDAAWSAIRALPH